MSRIALANINSLTFYKGSLTNARRTEPIQQLTCVGQPCKLYTPDVVRCTNVGGQGTEVDWRCEADLPESLRFGRVEVGCEGWSRPGDPYVLKGSCGLEYRLVHVSKELQGDHLWPETETFSSKIMRLLYSSDPADMIFTVVWLVLLGLMLYSFIRSCLRPGQRPGGDPRGPGPHHHDPSRRFPPDYDDGAPPPPYERYPKPSTGRGGDAPTEWWRPGFWTGAAVGGLGAAALMNRNRNSGGEYDWERERRRERNSRPFSSTETQRSRFGFDRGWEDRGEGPSTGPGTSLGDLRRSTGLGGSSVRFHSSNNKLNTNL